MKSLHSKYNDLLKKNEKVPVKDEDDGTCIADWEDIIEESMNIQTIKALAEPVVISKTQLPNKAYSNANDNSKLCFSCGSAISGYNTISYWDNQKGRHVKKQYPSGICSNCDRSSLKSY
jgi:hypothetical protein